MNPCFEAITADDNSSFFGKHFSCEYLADDHTWHYHPELELTWIMRSSGTRYVGDSIMPYQRNDLVLLGSNVPHCWHNSSRRDAPELVVLQFRPESLGIDFLRLPETQHITRLFSRAAAGLHVDGRTAEQVMELMADISEKSHIDRLLRLLEILNILAQSRELTPLASAGFQHQNSLSKISRQRIEFIDRYVRENLQCDIDQAEVAERVRLSPTAFSRFFHDATKQTFVRYVNEVRINAVCRRLAEGRGTITEIALNCGYNNIANFNRQFLAIKGMNPSQYLERRRSLVAHHGARNQARFKFPDAAT